MQKHSLVAVVVAFLVVLVPGLVPAGAAGPQSFAQVIELHDAPDTRGALVVVEWAGGGTEGTVKHHDVAQVRIPVEVTSVTVSAVTVGGGFCGGPQVEAVAPHHPGDNVIHLFLSPCE